MKIEDYGFLSDTETSALVGRNGSIDWLCIPRFDSAAVFARLLGTEDNGYWQIAPKGEIKETRRRYQGDTLILETEFETETGCVRLVDLMPLRDEHPDVVRIVEGVSGEVEMEMCLVIRFDYGRIVPWVQHYDGGIVATAGPDALILRSDVETHGKDLATVAQFTVKKGESKAFVLTWFPSHLSPPKAVNSATSLRRTKKYWKKWSSRTNAGGEWSKQVKRSLLTLKGLTYAPTGGVIAAATTSLPEQFGGERNWDYRFCWLRDSTFTLYSLIEAGYTEEAREWRTWLLRAIAGSPEQMQTLYGASGERRLLEYELPYLAGYEGAKPVRVGNAAAEQFQLDVYGEVLDTMHQARVAGIEGNDDAWALEHELVDFVTEHWTEPDEGIWEVRGGRKHFTHSKMMAWVAMDRAVQACEKFGREGNLEKWRKVRDEIHAEVCAKGYSEKRGSFVQYFGGDRLDASLLLMPLVGFLPPDDPRVLSTISTIERELMVDGFVYRYQADGDVDGLPPSEAAFLPCSFWLADCMAVTGRHDDARVLFERLLALCNDLGLIAEEYDPQARRLAGNFPQAFTHVALINTACNLAKVSGPAVKRGKGAKN